MPYTPFTEIEVRQIFQMSEGDGGHTGRMHVNMSKQELWQRVADYSGSKLALRTSFLTFADTVKTALSILNDPRNDVDLERFRVSHKGSGKPYFELLDRPFAPPVNTHYGMGGSAKLFPCRLASMILSKRPGRPRDMNIVTFFGTMGPMI